MILLRNTRNGTMQYLNILYHNEHFYKQSIMEILKRKPINKKLSCYSFSCSAIKLKNKNMESIIDKVIEQYSKNKRELIKKQIIPSHSLPQIDPIIEQVVDFESEKKELESFYDEDPELKKMAAEDLEKLKQQISSLKEKLYSSLLQCQNPSDISEIYVEISAGVGGQEAMLFAQDLFEMYSIFCDSKGWTVHTIDCERSDIGGIRHACLLVEGPDTYATLRFEGGIHRVQRVPKTERTGRIHTSTVSVAILPLPSEVKVHLDPKDLRIDTMKASGPGGQHVNTTDSAVRITHLPSGMMTTCQRGRSQDANKKEAMQKLRAMIYEKELDEQQTKFSNQKKLQVGTKARSEKIRTYNFLQDRVTDHRIGMSIHNISEILRGGQSLHRLITQLGIAGQEEDFVDLIENVNP